MNEVEKSKQAKALMAEIQARLSDDTAAEDVDRITAFMLAQEVVQLRYELKIEKELNKEVNW